MQSLVIQRTGEARDPLDLSGRAYLVTGGSGGIGRAVCDRLHAHGAAVAINYLRDGARARAQAERARERAVVLQANVADEEQSARLVDDVHRELGRLDGIVHCASLGTFTPLLETRARHWDATLDVHAKAFWMLASHAAPRMEPGSSLIAMSSLGAGRFTPHYGAVGVAKGALHTLIAYLAAELAPRGVRVNAVAGGPVEGERLQASPYHAELRREATRRPGGRFATPEEIADIALFLASPLSRWVQGQVIVADGGFSLW